MCQFEIGFVFNIQYWNRPLNVHTERLYLASSVCFIDYYFFVASLTQCEKILCMQIKVNVEYYIDVVCRNVIHQRLSCLLRSHKDSSTLFFFVRKTLSLLPNVVCSHAKSVLRGACRKNVVRFILIIWTQFQISFMITLLARCRFYWGHKYNIFI